MEITVTKWKLLALAIGITLIALDVVSEISRSGKLIALPIVAVLMIWFPGIYGVIWNLRREAVGGSGEPTPEGCVTGIGWFFLALAVLLTILLAR